MYFRLVKQMLFHGFCETEIQRNAISMGFGFCETEIQHRNIVQNLEHTRKQVILLKTLAKQRNAISMGFVKQKSSPIDSYQKFNQEASIIA